MALDTLGHLLEELSPLLKMPLKSNQQNTCMFKLDDTYLQIEIDKTGDFVLLVAKLGTVTPGKYRETLFQEALKHNGHNSVDGIFAYSRQSDILILFRMLPIKTTNGETLFALIPPFATKAKEWTEAISRGEIPISNLSAKGGTFGLFGSKR